MCTSLQFPACTCYCTQVYAACGCNSSFVACAILKSCHGATCVTCRRRVCLLSSRQVRSTKVWGSEAITSKITKPRGAENHAAVAPEQCTCPSWAALAVASKMKGVSDRMTVLNYYSCSPRHKESHLWQTQISAFSVWGLGLHLTLSLLLFWFVFGPVCALSSVESSAPVLKLKPFGANC